jgi:hypothetical protein
MGKLEKAEGVLKDGLELDPSNEALKKELEVSSRLVQCISIQYCIV